MINWLKKCRKIILGQNKIADYLKPFGSINNISSNWRHKVMNWTNKMKDWNQCWMKKKDSQRNLCNNLKVKKMSNKKTYKKPIKTYRHNIAFCRQNLTRKLLKKNKWFKHWEKRSSIMKTGSSKTQQDTKRLSMKRITISNRLKV